jgi:hypothetical protein
MLGIGFFSRADLKVKVGAQMRSQMKNYDIEYLLITIQPNLALGLNILIE